MLFVLCHVNIDNLLRSEVIYLCTLRIHQDKIHKVESMHINIKIHYRQFIVV